MRAVNPTNSEPALNAISLIQLAPYLARHNIDALDFMDRLDMAPNVFLQHGTWFSRKDMFDATIILKQMVGCDLCGAYAGNGIPIGGFGRWGGIVGAAESVEQACLLMARHLDLLHHGSDIRFVGEGGSLLIPFRFLGELGSDPLQFLLGTVAVMKNVASLGGDTDAVTVHLTMKMEGKARNLDECLGENIVFASRFDGIEIRRDALDRKLPSSRPDGDATAMETMIAAAALVEEFMPLGKVSIREVAQRLSLSVRTVQRRLKYCGVDFEDIVDITRRDAAVAQLEAGALSMTDLAFRLGYSDPAHFTRAFRRWTGKSPTRYRQEELRIGQPADIRDVPACSKTSNSLDEPDS